jgi:hypothetical protein
MRTRCWSCKGKNYWEHGTYSSADEFSFQIGGVAFNALDNDTVESIVQHLREVMGFTPITRQATLQQWSFSKLWATGSQMLRGGAKGDSYGPYAHHTTGTDEGIQALFCHAAVRCHCIFVRYTEAFCHLL